MPGKTVLLAGETWMSYGIHMKGFAAYTTGHYSEGMHAFVSAIEADGNTVVHIPNRPGYPRLWAQMIAWLAGA
jgi:uncharacterized membrane protein